MADVIRRLAGPEIIRRDGGRTFVLRGENTAEAARQVGLAVAQVALAEVVRADAEAAAAIALAAAGTAEYRLARDQSLARAVQAGAGDPAAIKLLLTADGAKSWADDDPMSGLIETIAPAIGPAGVLAAQNGAVWDGIGSPVDAALLPEETAEATVRLHRQTGLELDHGIIASAATAWCVDLVMDLPAIAATFATKAAADTDLDDYAVGAVIYVEGVAPYLTGLGGGYDDTPEDGLRGIITEPANLNGMGYYIRGNDAWDKLGYGLMFQILDSATAPTEDVIQLNLSGLGLPVSYVYDAGVAQLSTQGFYRDVLAAGGRLHWRLDHTPGDGVTLWVNGVEVATAHGTATFVPNRVVLNGFERTGSGTTTLPVNGQAYDFLALCISEGLDYSARRAVSDAIADHCGTPRVLWSPVAKVIYHVDQSRTSNANGSTVGEPNRPDAISNWNGHLAGRSPGDPLYYAPTQAQLPGVYTTRDAFDHNDQFGPFCAAGTVYGAGGGNHTMSGSGTETLEAGITAWLRACADVAASHIYFVAQTVGAQDLTYFQGQSGTFLHSLRSKTPAQLGNAPRDCRNRAMLALVERCHARGQRVEVVCMSLLQAENDATIAGTAATHEAALRAWWDNDVSKIVDRPGRPPLFLFKQPTLSYDGTGLGSNTAGANYADNAYRLLAANKDADHPIHVLGSIYAWCGRFIHYPQVFVRRLGEAIGFRIKQYLDGKIEDALQVVSVAIGAGGDAGKILLSVNRAVQTVATFEPTVISALSTGGFNSFGLIFDPVSGGRTINGHVTLSVDGLTIKAPISGGGPIAGDRISVTGAGARWSNFRAVDQIAGKFFDHTWGALPLSDADPAIDFTGENLNEITEWLAPSTHVLA